MNGTAVADVLTGTADGDVIAGLSGNDTISGLDGNDLLYGNQDQDSIDAGAGSNTTYGGMGNDFIAAGAGNDLLFGNEGSDTISAGDGDNTIVGGQDSTDGADLITSGNGNDLILGNGGDDTISAGGGNDIVVGGFGADVLLGNMGNDFVYGNQGNDTIYGGFGDDTLIGGMGDDTLYGNEGNDVLYGNEGNNLIAGGEGDDIAVFSGARSSYVVVQNPDGSFTLINSDGFNTVGSVEQFQFSDGLVNASSLITGPTNNGPPPQPPAPTQADLAITSIFSRSSPNVGDSIDITNNVGNSGPNAATGVTVQDLLPSGLTYVRSTPSAGTYDATTGLWNIGTVTNGGTATLIITALVTNPASVTNTATITHSDQIDPNVANNSATVSATPNRAPVANADAYTTPEDVALTITATGLLTNDTDADGNPLSVRSVTQPAHGTLVSNNDGTFTYSPNLNYNGTDSFSYIASDGPASSVPATVTISITPVNDAPAALSDFYSRSINAGTFTSGANGVLANDSDVDGNALTAIMGTLNPTKGTLQLNLDGSFLYVPNVPFVGDDQFSYFANDGIVNSAETLVTITYT